MRKDIESYVKSCATCMAMKKEPHHPGFPKVVAETTRLWEEIAMEFIMELPEGNGNTVIWTVIDLITKQTHFIACPSLPSGVIGFH